MLRAMAAAHGIRSGVRAEEQNGQSTHGLYCRRSGISHRQCVVASAQDQAELTRKLQNPVADSISAPLQSNWDFGSGSTNAMRYTLNVQPVGEIKGWHKAAPDLIPGSRLWERWQEKGLLDFLINGKAPNGRPAGPPMPTYTMTREDAEAVVAYLKSLK